MNIFSLIMAMSMSIIFILFIYMVITGKRNKKFLPTMWICNIIYWTMLALKDII